MSKAETFEKQEGEIPFIAPVISNIMEENDALKFTLSETNVSFANAIRRTILSDLDICCILSENHATNMVNIEVNTGRLHNEILKHRLSCIPVHSGAVTMEDMQKFCQEHILEIDCHNDSEVLHFVTTEDFHIKNKLTGKWVDSKLIFPPNKITNDYIDFSRLRPKISDSIPGESLKLTAEFSISNALHNSMYNVVSKCSYSNSIDIKKAEKKWEELHLDFKSKKLSNDEIIFEKRNFNFLDAHRHFIENSFDFVIQSIGIFENRQILSLACDKLIFKFNYIIHLIENNQLSILTSESAVNFSFDIILNDEDYTIGKILEFILYTHFFLNKKLSFCGFKKFHPHDTKSTIRIAFYSLPPISHIHNIIYLSSLYAIKHFHHILQFIK